MDDVIRNLTRAIEEMAADLPPVRLMEVCGTHTHAIARFGIRQILPPQITLVSGPGCPVCVTHESDIAAALYLAERENTVLCCYGDMMRVPCRGRSLYSLKAEGGDVRTVLSPLDVLRFAREEPQKEFVFFAVGFETTAPNTAALLEQTVQKKISDVSVLCAHKTMPAALRALLEGSRVNGLLCPGHVAAITGSAAFDFLPRELGIPAAVAGFEAADILAAVYRLCAMIRAGKAECINMYPRAVKEQGNGAARELVSAFFTPCDALWRGLGAIPQSGLALREEYKEYDARYRFDVPPFGKETENTCLCGTVLQGKIEPRQCPHFGRDCTPASPLGPCMVSSEGSCAAQYLYGPQSRE